jgi:hypothetical protein
MFQSEAEKIYQKWATSDAKQRVTPTALKSGAFDKFNKDGAGFEVVKTGVMARLVKDGTRATAETMWKLLDKFKRRHSDIIASEVLKVLQTEPSLMNALAQFPASAFTDLSDSAQETAQKLDLKNLHFKHSGKRVQVLKMIGQGGMGGAVFLGKDQNGTMYAVKHILKDGHKIWGYGGVTPSDHLHRTQHHLMQYYEASLTTTCIDTLTFGRDHIMLLQLGEGRVDYTTLSLADVISVFQDMQTAYEFAKNYMSVEVTQDVSVLHLDIHGENLMRFNGRLRLIDFGMASIYNPNQSEMWRRVKTPRYDKTDPDLYIHEPDIYEDKKQFVDPEKGSWKKYITNWQQSYREAPEVLLCQGCKRQYPVSLVMTECYRCGSKKLEKAKLRKADMEAHARLKGVSPGEIGDNPYANGSVKHVNPQQYGCIVLTAVLIKEVWAATEAGRDLGMGGKAARFIVNVEVYSKARKGLHTFKGAAAGTAGLIELLLMWFDEMMRRLFDGQAFTALDAVRFFGAARTTPVSRQRRHSVSF